MPLSNTPMPPQHLALVSEVAEAYSIAFSVAEAEERDRLTGLLEMLVQRGAHTKAELAASLELEIARGFLR